MSPAPRVLAFVGLVFSGALACAERAAPAEQAAAAVGGRAAAAQGGRDADVGASATEAGAGTSVSMAGAGAANAAVAGANAAANAANAASTANAGAGASAARAGTSAPNAGAGANAAQAGTDAAQVGACQRCSEYAAPKASGNVEPSDLSALSGLAMSRAQPDILFAHNDHDRPIVYALDLQGRLHATLTLENAQANDIEDIAVGPCGADTCVFLADVGDNAATRGEYGVLRFRQPEVPTDPGNTEQAPSFDALRFRYDDGAHNAESLIVAPNGTLYVITKLAPGSGGSVEATGPSSVYRIAADAFEQDAVATAEKVATLPIPMSGEAALSAAAAHPCGSSFLVRTYDGVYEFVAPSGGDFEAAFSATPQRVAMPDEPQSEGIDYRADGRGFVSAGEGAGAPIVLTECKP
jgi:hypothetical protein